MIKLRGKYAAVGPRTTPDPVLAIMRYCGRNLARRGWAMRSGGAVGADTAFALGATSVANEYAYRDLDMIQVLRPKHATPEAIALAERFHPAWDKCDEWVRKLMGRNAQIYLGLLLDDPVDFAVTWTPDRYAGGTGMGLRLADHYGIKVYNLYEDGALHELIAESK